MAPDEQFRDVLTPPPDDWRDAVCRRTDDRPAPPVDADSWNEVVRHRTDSGTDRR